MKRYFFVRGNWNWIILAAALIYILQAPPDRAAAGGLPETGKWKRFEVSFVNDTYTGNPFDLEFHGVFTHPASGRSRRQLGFYAGNNVWKIFFMPDSLGEWTYTTASPDPQLDQKTGSLMCVPSGLPGRLIPDQNRWKLEDAGKFDSPIMIPTRQWFKRTTTSNGVGDFIDWARHTVGARIIGTTLVYFRHAQDAVPYVKGLEGSEFNLEMWDRLNAHYDAIRDDGMGHYILFYSDDLDSPNSYGITEKSKAELRLFRYAVARLSCYPIVMWDTGIDISETRSNAWIDWFADWFNANDPWQHPVGSRTGGGSGGKHPANGTYYSDGASTLPDPDRLVHQWENSAVPLAFTDRWREDYYRGDFDRQQIRLAVWQMGLTGGAAVYVSGNNNDGYLDDDYAADFAAAADCGHASRFFEEIVTDFGLLAPHPELVISGRGVIPAADIGQEYVAYFPSGGSAELDLTNAPGKFSIAWYNPATGEYRIHGTLAGGTVVPLSAPDGSDWVLHLLKEGAPDVPADPFLPAPMNLRIMNAE